MTVPRLGGAVTWVMKILPIPWKCCHPADFGSGFAGTEFANIINPPFRSLYRLNYTAPRTLKPSTTVLARDNTFLAYAIHF